MKPRLAATASAGPIQVAPPLVPLPASGTRVARSSPLGAAALSTLVPGLGQWAEGRRRAAVLWLLPALVTALLLGALAVALAVDADDRLDAVALLVRPDVLRGLLVLDACLLVYHLAAIADAWRGGRAAGPGRRGRSVWAAAGLAVLLVATVAVHGAIGWGAFRTSEVMDEVFVPSDSGGMEIPAPGFTEPAPSDDSGIAVVPPDSSEPTEYPEPTDSEEPTDLAAPTDSPEPTGSPQPTDSPQPTAPAAPTGSSAPTGSAAPTRSAVPTGTAAPTASSGATASLVAATATPAPTAARTPRPTRTPAPTPRPTPVPAWAADGRLNLLLVGSDAGPDRWSLRTDTMIVLSVSYRTGRAAMFGIPRNLVNVPLAPEDAAAFPDGRFPDLLNALYTYAMAHPETFPGGQSRGFRAVAGAVQELVGVRLDGMVVVNLAGFVRLVNAVGGLWINVPYTLADPNYPLEDGTGWISVQFDPGCQHLDGRMALAYARSRHQDSDYGRMHRQQLVLLALRRQLDPLRLIPRIPDLLDAAGATLWTTLSPGDLASLARLAARVNPNRLETVFFVPNAYPEHLDDGEIAQIQSVVRNVFTHPSPPASGGGSGGTCGP